MTHTLTRHLPPDAYQALCGMAAFAMETLPLAKWRHSGLGVLQAYIFEGTEREMRLHVWHSSLRKPGIEESGLYHDHRFDLNSIVLVGDIAQREIETYPAQEGAWMMYEVLHARAAHDSSRGATFHAGPSPMAGRYVMTHQTVSVPEEWSYDFPKAQFHGTYFVGKLAVTLLTKSAQEDFRARILAPRDVPIVHAFEDPLPPEAWEQPLHEAHQALMDRWRR